MRRPRSLLILTALAAVVGPSLVPAPVAADPARPTDLRSEIIDVRPALPAGVQLAVVGGDAFLELRVSRGHTVEVPDYEQGRDRDVRPYLRFRADGLVERNEASLAARVNDDRFGGGSGTPPDPDAAPRWRVVAHDGRHAWHDHRIHWMLRRPPKAVDDRGRVDLGGEDGTWEVPLVVDGQDVLVRGELLLLDPPSPVPWVSLSVLVAFGLVGVAVAARRRGRAVPHVAIAAALAGIGLLATVVALVAWRAVPPGTGPGPTSTLVAAAAALLAIATTAALLARRRDLARVTWAASVAALGSWAFLRRDVLTHAWLPTELPFAADRGVTALALGAAAGAAVVLVWRPPASGRTHEEP